VPVVKNGFGPFAAPRAAFLIRATPRNPRKTRTQRSGRHFERSSLFPRIARMDADPGGRREQPASVPSVQSVANTLF